MLQKGLGTSQSENTHRCRPFTPKREADDFIFLDLHFGVFLKEWKWHPFLHGSPVSCFYLFCACACLNVGTATIWYHELLLLLSFLYATSAFNTDVENHYSQLHSVEVEWKINIIVHVLIKLPLGIVLMMFLLQVKSNNHFAPVWPWTYFEKPHFFCIKQLSVK